MYLKYLDKDFASLAFEAQTENRRNKTNKRTTKICAGPNNDETEGRKPATALINSNSEHANRNSGKDEFHVLSNS
jgi:hypothetical protein